MNFGTCQNDGTCHCHAGFMGRQCEIKGKDLVLLFIIIFHILTGLLVQLLSSMAGILQGPVFTNSIVI